MLFRLLALFGLISLSVSTFSQDLPGTSVSGSFQTDVQYLFPDSAIGAVNVDEKIYSNSFFQLNWQQGNLHAGIRYEAYLDPLLGFDRRYQGQGIAWRAAGYRTDRLAITAGNIYDQFGNGIVFRAYQEWALGIDNSIDGLHVRFMPVKGLTVKGILGKQRLFFERSAGIVRGADVELAWGELFPNEQRPWQLTLGASAVNRFERDDDPRLQLPENVSAFAGRASLRWKNWSLDGEYAWKINDPFQLNRYVYNPGSALYLNLTWARQGIGVNLSGKRIDNFDFRSQRRVNLQEATLSFLPPLSRLHTYRLPTLYPYATQLNGEVGVQATVFLRFKKNSPLGGKYGAQLTLNYSRLHGLDTSFTEPGFRYETPWEGDPANLYFEDMNIEYNRKWNARLRTVLTYIHLKYNKDIIEFASPNAGFGVVSTHIAVVELQYRLGPKVALRTELQHMYTRQDLGSWAMALGEISFSPHWFISVFDEFNYGNPDPARRVHYYNGQVAYAFESTRIALGYSRQRRGLLCVGGICREVPASNGFGLNITSSF